MREIFDSLMMSRNLDEFVTNYNSLVPKSNWFTRTIFKPKSCQAAFKNKWYFVTDCHKDTYDKAGFKTPEEYKELLDTLKSLNHPSIIKLFHYDLEKNVIIWENVSDYYPLNTTPDKFNIICSPFVKQKHLKIIENQLDDVTEYLSNNGLTHLDLEIHNIGFDDKTELIKLLDMLSIRKIGEKHKGLFDRGQIDRPDMMNPPFIKFFDARLQMEHPKVLVLGNQQYFGKPCLDKNKNTFSDLGRQIAISFLADYYHYSKFPTIYTKYDFIIAVLNNDDRGIFFSNDRFFIHMLKVAPGMIFLDDKSYLHDLNIKLTRNETNDK